MKNPGIRRIGVALIAVACVVCAAAVVLVPMSASAAKAKKAKTWKVTKHVDIAYRKGKDAHARQKLDVYQPRKIKNAPVLIFIHGGAWVMGNKSRHDNFGRAFASRGIVVVCINYRLSPGVMHPEHIRDAARAFAWVKKNVRKYGSNPKKIFVSGHSAGGHLSALLALNEKYLTEVKCHTRDIAGAIPISGPSLILNSPIFRPAFPTDADSLTDASPVKHVDEAQPPFLVIHAENDRAGLRWMSSQLVSVLKRHKSDVTSLEAKSRTHLSIITSIGRKDDPTTAAILKFIRKHSIATKKKQ